MKKSNFFSSSSHHYSNTLKNYKKLKPLLLIAKKTKHCFHLLNSVISWLWLYFDRKMGKRVEFEQYVRETDLIYNRLYVNKCRTEIIISKN